MEEQMLPGIDFSTAPKELLEVLLEESEDPSIFIEIAKANMNRHEILMLLLENLDTPAEVKQLISDTLHVPVAVKADVPKVAVTPEMRSLTLLQRIQRLSFGEKRLLALRGGKDVRSILVKDPNREIVLAVLDNPKLTETEIEIIAKSPFLRLSHRPSRMERALGAITHLKKATLSGPQSFPILWSLAFGLELLAFSRNGLSVSLSCHLRRGKVGLIE